MFYGCFFFFFQAEDGIRDHCVTGVQTCALPIFGGFRTEDIDEKPFLKQLLLQAGSENCRELFIGPLAGGEARELTRSLFAAADVSGEPFIDSIVHEAAGSPFLLEQLTHYGMMNERAATAGISLTTMLEERMKQLPPGA